MVVGQNFNVNDVLMLDFLTLKNITDPHEMSSFMGFIWLFIVCQNTCKSVSRMKKICKDKV